MRCVFLSFPFMYVCCDVSFAVREWPVMQICMFNQTKKVCHFCENFIMYYFSWCLKLYCWNYFQRFSYYLHGFYCGLLLSLSPLFCNIYKHACMHLLKTSCCTDCFTCVSIQSKDISRGHPGLLYSYLACISIFVSSTLVLCILFFT